MTKTSIQRYFLFPHNHLLWDYQCYKDHKSGKRSFDKLHWYISRHVSNPFTLRNRKWRTFLKALKEYFQRMIELSAALLTKAVKWKKEISIPSYFFQKKKNYFIIWDKSQNEPAKNVTFWKNLYATCQKCNSIFLFLKYYGWDVHVASLFLHSHFINSYPIFNKMPLSKHHYNIRKNNWKAQHNHRCVGQYGGRSNVVERPSNINQCLNSEIIIVWIQKDFD